MRFFLDILRRILFGGDVDRSNESSSSSSTTTTTTTTTTGHCGNYNRIEDRSPLHPRNPSSSESYPPTTTLLYPCKPSVASLPLNASVSPPPSLLSRFSTPSGPLPSNLSNDSAPKVSSGASQSSSPPPKSKTLPFSTQSSSHPSESKTLLFSSQFQQADASRRSPGTTTSKQKHTPDARDGNPELNGKTSANVSGSTDIWVKHQASTKPSKPSSNASASPLTSSISSKLPTVADPPSSKCSSALPASSSHGPSTEVWIKRQSTLNYHDKSSLLSSTTLPSNTSNITDTFDYFFQKQQILTPKTNHHDSTLISRDYSSDSSSSTTPHSSEASPFFKKRTLAERYEIPEDIEKLIKINKLPAMVPLTPSSYADYFRILLYAEDYELEKWSKYLLEGITLELRKKTDFKFHNSRQISKTKNNQNDQHSFVAFEIKAVPENRPYLLSRDFVFVRPSYQISVEPFKGVIVRVVKSKTILVEFGSDFHKQHSSTKKYDVSFSFNRVCLKRSHIAISAATNPLLCIILFPNPKGITDYASSDRNMVSPTIDCSTKHFHVIRRILNHKGLVPYLIEGPLAHQFKELTATEKLIQEAIIGPLAHQFKELTATGKLIQEAIIQIHRNIVSSKILICAPRNVTCDALMRSLLDEIPKTKLFRANAAFRDMEHVPDDIMPTCLFEGECFTCPPIDELKEFDIVSSTYMSSFRLHDAGIEDNHFSHIFLVDASSSMEPEAIVALANLVCKKTVIVITGSMNDSPRWVRSKIGRRWNGLRRSLFHRLMESEPYSSMDPEYVANIRSD